MTSRFSCRGQLCPILDRFARRMQIVKPADRPYRDSPPSTSSGANPRRMVFSVTQRVSRNSGR